MYRLSALIEGVAASVPFLTPEIVEELTPL
jgi:hypothetical protein